MLKKEFTALYNIEGIYKDYSILGYNTYLTQGQGCATVWFKSVPVARKALLKDGIKTGADLSDCTKCNCSYSMLDKENYNKYPDFACQQACEEYAKSFEPKKRK